MKKILIFIVLLLSTNLFAQSTIKIWDAYSKVWKIIGDTSTASYTPMPVSVIGSVGTVGGALEATQLDVLAQLENRVNLGGLQTYSARRGDFTVTPINGTKKVKITGANFTVAPVNVAYTFFRSSGGSFHWVNDKKITLLGADTLQYDSSDVNFTSTDVVEVVFIGAEKTLDKSLDVTKNVEQAPIWARYQIDEIYDGTNLAAGTNYYPASTGASMDGYKGLSFTGKLIDADSTVTVTIEATNDEDATNADWIQVYFTDVKNDTTVNSISVSDGTTTFAIKLTDFNYSLFRVKVVTTDATNTVIIKQRRLY